MPLGPYSSFEVPVAGGSLHVGRWGAGDHVVVAAHGITGNHRSWQAVARALGPEVSLIAPDLRGRGRSTHLPGPYGMRSHAEDLAAIHDHLRLDAASYGLAPSWWDWQETNTAGWGALGSTAADPLVGYRPIVEQPLLKRGSRGDLVVWAQEHLVGAGQTQLPVTGVFGKQTYSAVRSFQAANGLAADGAIGTTTWSSLLSAEPAQVRWAARPVQGAGRVLPTHRPISASLPAHAYEIRPGPAP